MYSLDALAEPARMIDSEVDASGIVFTYFNNRGELVGARLLTAGSGDWKVTRRGPANPFDAIEVPLATLRPFSPAGLGFNRRRSTGTVTLARPGQFFYMQRDGRGIRVETRDATSLEPGDQVEASGFVSVAEHFGKFREAAIRRVGKALRPNPDLGVCRWTQSEVDRHSDGQRILQSDQRLQQQSSGCLWCLNCTRGRGSSMGLRHRLEPAMELSPPVANFTV